MSVIDEGGAGISVGAQGPALILLGVAGAGKTTVGRLLADRLGVELVETDDLVAEATNLSIAELVISQDPRLPVVQRRAALAALAPGGRARGAVVTLGASVPMDAEVAEALRKSRAMGSRVIELVADTAEIARRGGVNAPRGGGVGAPRAMLTMMIRQLRQVYAEFADESVATVSVAPATLAEQIAGSL